MTQIVSSISGIEIYAPSAGFAPTNSADVSAIASGYQVVSSTATQLYAGTAFLTSVNETPVSASRAGNAANAGMANSAYYDGTGRLISALPDSAAVSGIASSYAESAASGKQDALTFDWDADSAISSINGSALAGQGGGAPIVVTGTAWDPDTSAWVFNLSSNVSAAERHVWEFQNGGKQDFIEYIKDDSGNKFPMLAFFLAAGAEQMYYGGGGANGRLNFSPSYSMFSADGSNVYGLAPLTFATGASMNLSAGYFRASYRGDTIFISRGPTGTIDSSNSAQIKAVRIEAHNSRGANISAYGANSTGYYGDTGMRLSHSGVFVDDSGNSSNTASNLTLTTGSIKFNSAGSSDVMSQSSIPYWNAKLDSSAIECDTASAITAIGGSSIAGGGVDEATVSAIASAYQVVSSLGVNGSYATSINDNYISATHAFNAEFAKKVLTGADATSTAYISSLVGIDSADVSAIASAYAESSVSAVSGDYYSTSNPSGFITGMDLSNYATTGYVDSSVSGKLDESASSSFYTTANESGFLTGLPVDISVRDLSASRHVRATTTGQDLYGNFDYAGMYFRSGSQRPYNIGIDNTGTNFYIATAKNGFERIYASSIQSWNGKQDASAMTAYQLSGDYAYNSSVSGKADSSALTAYQEISGMTAYQPAGDYQPSGDYIYVSALGWAEV